MTNTASQPDEPKVTQRARLRNNMAWLAAERAVRLLIGVFVFGAVARKLGAESFGLLNYSYGLIAIFATLASLGMDGIVIRELMLHPDKRDSILGTATIMRLIGSAACLGCGVVASLFSVHHPDVPVLTLIIGLGMFPMSMEVIDWWFQMRTESGYTVKAKLIASFIGSALKLTLVAISAPLHFFAAALAFDGLAIGLALIWTYRSRHGTIRAWSFEAAIARGILRDAWPLIISGLLVALYLRIEQLVVMGSLGSRAAGVYYAAAKFAEVWNILPAIVASTLYPRLVEWKSRDPAGYAHRLQFMFDAMTALGLVIAVGTVLFGPLAVKIVFGQKYAGAEQILIVLGLIAPLSFSGTARAQYMLLERVTIHHTIAALSGIAVNFSLSLYLVSRLGPVGAALGSLAGFFVSAYAISWAIPALRPCAGLQTRALLTPWGRLIKANRN